MPGDGEDLSDGRVRVALFAPHMSDTGTGAGEELSRRGVGRQTKKFPVEKTSEGAGRVVRGRRQHKVGVGVLEVRSVGQRGAVDGDGQV